MFYDVRRFPFVDTIEKHTATIRAELDALLQDEFQTYRDFTPWKVFILRKGIGGAVQDYPDTMARCPNTTEIIRSIPGITTAGFSRLMPGSWLWPHRCEHTRVRCHLGLVIVPKCGIRVGGMTRHWEEGKVMIFNPTYVHEAWNYSSALRTVLLFDVHPDVVGGHPEQWAQPKTPLEMASGQLMNARYHSRKAYFWVKTRFGGEPDKDPH